MLCDSHNYPVRQVLLFSSFYMQMVLISKSQTHCTLTLTYRCHFGPFQVLKIADGEKMRKLKWLHQWQLVCKFLYSIQIQFFSVLYSLPLLAVPNKFVRKRLGIYVISFFNSKIFSLTTHNNNFQYVFQDYKIQTVTLHPFHHPIRRC